jgi:hypothetical protein
MSFVELKYENVSVSFNVKIWFRPPSPLQIVSITGEEFAIREQYLLNKHCYLVDYT